MKGNLNSYYMYCCRLVFKFKDIGKYFTDDHWYSKIFLLKLLKTWKPYIL